MSEQNPLPKSESSLRPLLPEVLTIIEHHQEWIKDCFEEFVDSIEIDSDAKWRDSARQHFDDPRRADFTQNKLEDIVLHRFDLRGAKFDSVQFENAVLNDGHLEYAYMPDSHLENAKLIDTHLEHAYLYKANLEYAILRRSHLEYTNLNGSNLEHTILEGAYLEYSSLFGTHFEYADLSRVRLENAFMLDAYLESVILRGAHLEQSKLINAHLDNADLFRAHLQGTDFNKATLLKTNASQATFSGAKFFVTKIRSCDFSHAEFRHWKTKTDKGEDIIIETEGLYDSQFADCDLTGARLPEGVAKFESLAMMNESTKANKRLL